MRLHRPSSAALLAGTALFVALGGTSYAVSKLPKNSVGTEQVRDRSLTGADLAAGVAVSGPRGPRGAQGPAGSQGPTGPQGAAGAAKVYVNRTDANTPLRNSQSGPVTVAALLLPAGSYAIDWAGHPFETGQARPFVDCALKWPGHSTATASVLGLAGSGQTPGEPAQEVSMSISEAITVTALTKVTVDCATRDVTTTAYMATSRLRALPVDAIEEQ